MAAGLAGEGSPISIRPSIRGPSVDILICVTLPPDLTAAATKGNLVLFIGAGLSQAANLTVLLCDNNQLVELDLSLVPNLKVLLCDNNQLTELDIRNLRNLEDLHYDPAIRLIQRPDQNF